MFLKAVDIHSEPYIKLAREHGSVFNQPEWLAIYDSGLEVVGIYNTGNTLIGAFNLLVAKRFGLRFLRVPPYMPHNALFFVNPALTLCNKITVEKELYTLIANFLKTKNAALTLTALPPAFSDTQVFYWHQFKVIPNYTYILNLKENDLFGQFSSERRKSIRKAEKDNIVVKETNDYTLVKALVEKTFNRKQKSISQQMLDAILFRFASPTNSFAFVAYKDAKPSACTFCIYSGNTVYYLLGGYDAQNKHHGAGALCMYQSIVKAQTLGLSVFDFEGSMLPEVEKYFREFGGTLTPYYTINKARLWLEMMLKFKKRSQF